MAHQCLRRITTPKQYVFVKFLQPSQPLLVQCAFLKDKTSRIGLYEYDRRSGYQSTDKRSVAEKVKESFQMFPKRIQKFRQENSTVFTSCDDIEWLHANGDYKFFCKFDGKESLEDWIVTTDRDNLEGSSRAYFTVSKNNKGLFHGYLCTKTPEDGLLTRTGYCSIKSPHYEVGSEREFQMIAPTGINCHDWSMYTHLVLRVRGDGRPYMLNVLMDMYFDINWNDQFNYTLYTRGGPYWQTAKIPFSKFYRSYKGRIQDKQGPLLLNKVKNLLITLADGVEGHFKLEIDYIALLYDENHKEQFAYEMYSAKSHMVGT